jgi:beta-lactamase regulating signal transducer with metallopeptidase domain
MAAAPPITFLAARVAAAAHAGWQIAAGPAWEHALPWLALVWVLGVALFSARLIGGWRVATRMRRVAVAPAPAEWRQALDGLMARMKVSAPVRLLASSLAPAPMVLGWLRPVILAPVGMLTGLPAEQVRALLAHELAHILRRDYLVNILQSVVEAALFYHPAVWWISERIRVEREACCDDMAVEATGDPVVYASALADLDSRRRARLRLATAANGGSLVSRIRRLLGHAEPVSHALPGFAAGWAMSLLWLAGLGAVMAQGAHSPAVARRAFVPPAAAAAPSILRVAPPPAVAMPLAGALLFDPFFAMPLPQTAPADADKQLASVSGVVMSTSGTPVAQAQVILLPTAPPAPSAGSPQPIQNRSVTSDAAGKFVIDKIPPGAYRMLVSHPLYVSAPAEPGSMIGTALTLTAGQRMADITVKLMEPGTVSGRVVDEDDDPVVGARIEVDRYAYSNGRRRLSTVAAASSGDDGEFKVGRVPAGTFIVKTGSQPHWTVGERAPIPADKPGQTPYNPNNTFYGGNNLSTSAAPVNIAPGQDVTLGVIKMRNQPSPHVRGKVVGDMSLLAGARVVRLPTDAGGALPWSYASDIQKDGSFDMANMYHTVPGDAVSIGVYNMKLGGVLAWTTITVRPEGEEGVTLSVAAAPLSGTVRIEGSAPDAPTPSMRITLAATGAVAVITQSAAVNPDGSFRIPLLAAGRYAVEMSGLPAGSYVKSVKLTGNGSPDLGLDWRGASSGALEVIVSPKAASLDGTVHDDDDNPVAGTVTLVPVPLRPGHASLYPTATADAQGHFSFPSITPGQYKVYAWEEIEPTAHRDPELTKQFESRGESIDVGEGGHATVSLKRSTAAEMRDALRGVV